MNSGESVSVLIPCYNAARWIGEALDSVFAQHGVALQVIVVDDGSTDDSASLVTRDFPRVELVRTRNGGQCHARNVGLQYARYNLIQFLDADDWLLPDKIARQVNRMTETGADIIYSDWCRQSEQPDGTKNIGEPVVRQLEADAACELVRGSWSPPHAYLFRREIIDRAGGFPESYLYTGDARFAIECALRGARFAREPGVLAMYRIHPQQLSGSNRYAFCRECLSSTQEAQQWWEQHGGLTPQQHAALVEAYTIVTRASYQVDRGLFDESYHALLKLEPHFAPGSPLLLNWASRAVGYPRAEALAGAYRRVKRS